MVVKVSTQFITKYELRSDGTKVSSLVVDVDEEGSDPLGIIGLVFPSIRFTLTASSLL